MKETPGAASTPIVLAMLRLDADWPTDDSTPWCSAWLNWICWLLRLPRSKSLAARSWLDVGTPVAYEDATPGFDVVVLARGAGGHVGLFAGREPLAGGLGPPRVLLLGGNQGDTVSIAAFDRARILGIRRLA